MNPQTVSTLEFRAELAKYLENQEPLAISQHGRIIGYYIPAGEPLEIQEFNALRLATERLQTMLLERGITEDAVVEGFRHLIKQDSLTARQALADQAQELGLND